MAGDQRMNGDSFEEFVSAHQVQLTSSDVPRHFWRRLHEKLRKEIFDAGDYFQIICEELGGSTPRDAESENSDAEEDHDGQAEENRPDVNSKTQNNEAMTAGKLQPTWQVVATARVDQNDGNSIFLVDHAWTFRPQQARQHLMEIPGLLDRMASYVGLDGKYDDDDEKKLDAILANLWKHAQTYSVRLHGSSMDESQLPVWYIADEFGGRIPHDDSPTVRMVPIYYLPQRAAYSLVFPTTLLEEGDLATRDFADTTLARSQPELRRLLLHPWLPVDMSDCSSNNVRQPDDFYKAGRSADTLPPPRATADVSSSSPSSSTHRFPRGHKWKVFADDKRLLDHLRNVRVEYVDEQKEAQVLWMRTHFHDYLSLSAHNPNVLINQFPFESVLTVKDLFAAAVHLKFGVDQSPDWFQKTYNLNTELPQFIAYYQQQEKSQLDNSWIVKPWNLARGMDTHVTDNLAQIIRLIESGPKIACKYIDDPVLFKRSDNGSRVKFDLRFIVLVRLVGEHPEVYLYNNFWLRFAINQFSLQELDDHEAHFTVFNYADPKKILQMYCKDFINEFERQYPSLKWTDIQPQINNVIKEAVLCACHSAPPKGIAPNGQSRAMYGFDLMLKWPTDSPSLESNRKRVEVTFLEANFMPDCERACEYYPHFADTVFETMFLPVDQWSEATQSEVAKL